MSMNPLFCTKDQPISAFDETHTINPLRLQLYSYESGCEERDEPHDSAPDCLGYPIVPHKSGAVEQIDEVYRGVKLLTSKRAVQNRVAQVRYPLASQLGRLTYENSASIDSKKISRTKP